MGCIIEQLFEFIKEAALVGGEYKKRTLRAFLYILGGRGGTAYFATLNTCVGRRLGKAEMHGISSFSLGSYEA